MDFYHGLFQVQGFSMLALLGLSLLIPLVVIVHCVLKKQSARVKLAWILPIVVLAGGGVLGLVLSMPLKWVSVILVIALLIAMLYLFIARKQKPLGWLLIIYLLLALFTFSFQGALNWYIVYDAKRQAAIAEERLKTLKMPELFFQEKLHVTSYARLTIGIAKQFRGSFAQAPPIVRATLVESVNFLRLFNALTQSGELTAAKYQAFFPKSDSHLSIGGPKPAGSEQPTDQVQTEGLPLRDPEGSSN